MKNLETHNCKNIIFFDGICGMCNNLVDKLILLDKKNNLLFSPLQGTTAQELLPKTYTSNLNTFVFWKNGKLYEKSEAGIQALASLGGIFTLAKVLLIIPRFISDAVYMAIAKRRYKWFGKKESCRIPTLEERAKFLP